MTPDAAVALALDAFPARSIADAGDCMEKGSTQHETADVWVQCPPCDVRLLFQVTHYARHFISH